MEMLSAILSFFLKKNEKEMEKVKATRQAIHNNKQMNK